MYLIENVKMKSEGELVTFKQSTIHDELLKINFRFFSIEIKK